MSLPTPGTNKMLALSYIMKNGQCSRKNLAKMLGVTRASVTKIASELIQDGMIIESGETDTGVVGRNEVNLVVAENAGYCMGIDISIYQASVSIISFHGDLVYLKEFSYTEFTEEILKKIILCAKKQLQLKSPIAGIAILAQGYIQNELCQSLSVPDVQKQVEQVLERKCILLNNVKAMAIVEQFYQEMPADFLLLKYGPGVGGAIVVDHNIIQGKNSSSGELGHISWEKEHPDKCMVCGKQGCLETVVSYDAVYYQMTGTKKQNVDFNTLYKLCKKNQNEDGIAEALKTLAHAATMMIQFLDPGALVLAGEPFTKPEYFKLFCDELKVLSCPLKEDEIRAVSDYSEKRKKAASITALDAFIKG